MNNNYTINSEFMVVQAIEFDGTAKGVEKVKKFMEKIDPNAAVTEFHGHETGTLFCQITRIISTEKFRFHFLQPTDYLVIPDKGEPYVLQNNDFKTMYEE